MPVFREHMRSSDSTDFERTATLKDIDDMAFGQETQTDSGRHSLRVTGTRLLSRLGGVSLSGSPEKSRGRAAGSQPPHLAERLLIFRDEYLKKEYGAQGGKSHSVTFHVRPHCSESVRTQRHPPFDEQHNETGLEARRLMVSSRDEEDAAVTNDTKYDHLVQRLQMIATKRAVLLDQLHVLQQAEGEILAQLAQMPQSLPVQTRPLLTPPTQPLNIPPPRYPRMSHSKVPLFKPSKISQRPVHTRNLSTPTASKSRRVSEGSDAVETVKRVRLSEKEEVMKIEDIKSHSRSRSERVVARQVTGQAFGAIRSGNRQDNMVTQLKDYHDEFEDIVVVSDILLEMRFPVRSRAQLKSSVRSQGSMKSQGSIRNHGRSKSRDSTNIQEGKKSLSRDKSKGRNQGRAAVAVQPPAVEKAKPAEMAPNVFMGKKWEF